MSSNKIDNRIESYLIEDRIKNFLGYGNLNSNNSNIWFIGLEEACGDGEEKIRMKSSYQKEIMDLRDLKEVKGHMDLFVESPNIQKTWKVLIKILLALDNEDINDLEKIRLFQRDKLGRSDGNHCLLELNSLPSKSTKVWEYSSIIEDSRFKDRNTYIIPERVKVLRRAINKHKPKTVIFYGKSKKYLDYWKDIVGKDLDIIDENLYIAKNPETLYIIIPHPTYIRSNHKWEMIIKRIVSEILVDK